MKLDAIIILTNQCNLNCAHCVYACDLKPNPYFITIQELQNTLILMK
jgi:MoaA/NifB/PqqE/SkfB family radical SAM enzyme